jgi:uncharacterized protein YgbK (DUF1537 family)
MNAPKICFYGDDFTGASENLAQFHRHGLKCRLYFEPADHARVRNEAPDLDVVGIAGVSRSQSPAPMRQLLENAFSLFASLGTRLNQYKVCSTFDSAPQVGNFAVAVDVAKRFWPDATVPVLPATPDFGRYTAFANLFSRHREEIFRLDRNPAMVNHPSTPMHEADLRRHLAALGTADPAAVMLPELGLGPEALAGLIATRGSGGRPVVLDAIDNEQLRSVCAAIWQLSLTRSVFCLAAQGLPQGIGGLIAGATGRQPSAPVSPAVASGPGLVLSGSCAEQTAVQLAFAEAAAWEMIEIPIARLGTADEAASLVDDIAPRMIAALTKGRSVAAFTARGAATEAFDAERSATVGMALAALFRKAVRETGIRRVIFAGGDSSSHAMRASGAYALEIASHSGRQASHVCRLLADDEIDGTEVILKGGQAGGDEFFIRPMG